MAEQGQSEQFVTALIQSQGPLYAYVLSLLADPDAADDVLQETNVVLWRKADEFTAGTSFIAWALRVAYFQCQAHRKRQSRDNVRFSDELLEKLAARTQTQLARINNRLDLLRRCMGELTDRQRELLELRYAPHGSVQQIAQQQGRPAATISQTLFRIRTLLLECVQRRALGESES